MTSRICAVTARLFGLPDAATGRREPVAHIRMVTDGTVPELVMFDGEPYVGRGLCGAELLFVKVKPFRADAGLVVGPSREDGEAP